MAKYKSPEMVWTSQDLSHEWRRFYRQASCILDGPLHDKEENVKVSYLKMWVGDKARGCSKISGGSEKVRRVLCSEQKPHHGRFEVQ